MSGGKDWKVKGLFDQSRFFLENVLLKHFYALGLGKDNYACFGVGLYVRWLQRDIYYSISFFSLAT